MQELQASDNTVSQWLTFVVENETYGIEVLKVIEILSFRELAPVPGSPNYVLGIISLRGEVITVNNIRLLLGFSEKDITNQSRIILLDIGDQAQGILVDSVAEIVSIQTSEIETANHHGGDCPFIKGTYQHQDKLLILVAVDKLLLEEGPSLDV